MTDTAASADTGAQTQGASATTGAAQPAASAMSLAGGSPTAQTATTQPTGDRPPIFGGHVNEQGAFLEGWTDAIRAAGYETLAGKLQTAKDEKGALSILDNAIKTASRRELKGAPNESWADHEIAEFRRSFGIPDDPQAYQLKPENLPEGVAWDDNQAREFAELAHKLNIPESTAKALVEYQLQSTSKAVANAQESLSAEIAKLAQESFSKYSKEWGADFQSRLQANKDFIASRLTPEDMANPAIQTALSHPAIVDLVDQARLAFRGAGLPGATNAQVGSESPQQQAERIMKDNPRWRTDPTLADRVEGLMKMQAQINKRS